MKSNILIMLFILLITGCATVQTQNSNYFQVIEFEQGKMRKSNDAWSIYEHGNRLTYKENGQCNLNGQYQSCMWHGFILKYKTNAKKPVLKCTVHTNRPMNFGNPNEMLSKHVQTIEFELPLDEEKSIFINPQYSITPNLNYELSSQTICKFKGIQVLEFEGHIIPDGSVKT